MNKINADKNDLHIAWFEFSRKDVPRSFRHEDWISYQAFKYGYRKGVQATYSQLRGIKRDEIIVGFAS